jgi:benzoylformate decarboxylase
VTRLEDLPRIVHRAAKIATTPPTGPVFISLPGDILNAFGVIDLGQATRVDTRVRPSEDSLRELAERLLRAKRPVIIAGHEIIRSDAFAEAARFAAPSMIRRCDTGDEFGAAYRDALAAREPVYLEVIVDGSV